MEGSRFVASRNAGLITGAIQKPAMDAPETPSLGSYGLLNLENWAKPGASPIKTLDELERAAAREGVGEGASANARLSLARYLLSIELAPEALGALRVAAINQPLLANDSEFRLMRAAAQHYPHWSFDTNKGYPCPVHKTALQGYGPSAIHRRTWVFMDNFVPWPGVPRALTAAQRAAVQESLF
jgi:hypothetical protein